MKKIILYLCLLSLYIPETSFADISFGDIKRFYNIDDDNALLAIPRRKIHIDGDSVYIFHKSAGASTRYWVHSSDKGETWDTVGVNNQDGNIGGDYYDSHFHSWYAEGMHFCTGQATNVPLWYRYINKPVQSGSDKENQIILDSRNMNWVPTIVASSADEIWMVARYSADSLVYYHTTDRFQTVAHTGFIGNVNLARIDMRIGSCMDENGNAIFVALLTGVSGGQNGYYYWQWDDLAQDFVGRSDSVIAVGDIGMSQRGWSINYVNNRLHLVFAEAPWASGTTYIHHYFQNGIGGWSHDTASVIGSEIGLLSYPILTSRSDSLYLFYSGGPDLTMKIFDLNTLTWQPTEFSVAPSNETSRSIQVPQTVTGNYIPVSWINRSTKTLTYRNVYISGTINTDIDNDGIPNSVDNCPNHANSLQEDFDNDGIGDACCCIGGRGNINSVEGIDISDIVFLVSFLFLNGDTPNCILNSDLDNSGGIDISDLVYMISFTFQNGPDPVPCE